MNIHVLSPLLIAVLTATQVLGPATLWAVEERGVRIDESRRVVIAGIDGASLTVQKANETKAGQFREVVNSGDRLATGDRTVAEVLIGTRAVVILGPSTTMQLVAVSDEQAVIQVMQGLVRVAAAPSRLGSQGVVTIQTPIGQVQTHGGIVRVLVETPIGKAESVPTDEAKLYRASYASGQMMAVASPQGEVIQVDEGTAEILGVGGKLVTIQAGQSVTLQAGRVGVIGEGVKTESLRPGVVATQGHTQTPKEGRDYLIALQVDQATKLGKALTGAAETTGQGESEKKSDTKSVINGATGGVTLQNNLVNALFGRGGTANVAGSTPLNTTGTGYGGNNNNGIVTTEASDLKVKGNGGSALLVFTRKDPVEAFVKEERTLPGASNFGTIYTLDGEPVTFTKNSVCGTDCLASHYHDAQKDPNDPLAQVVFDPSKPLPENVGYRPWNSTIPKASTSVTSNFTVTKELVLIGGTSNNGHGGIAPTESLVVRGAAQGEPVKLFRNEADTIASSTGNSFDGPYPTDRFPAKIGLFAPTPTEITKANSTFVVKSPSSEIDGVFKGGTLSQFSYRSDGGIISEEGSFVDGSITATTAKDRPSVVLSGGGSLDQETTATIGTTKATDTYFTSISGTKFTGSLLSVIHGPNKEVTTALTMQDRMLGVYDGSIIKTNGGNKALLSVLDAKLKGPGSSIPLIDIAAGTHFDRDGNPSPGSQPNVTVTSALVTRSTIPLDSALLEASAPLFALTQANMTTTSHFADLAGKQAQSLNLGDALVALNASKLIINSGHLLNLDNATAAIGGYLFSLTNGSTLQLNNGSLFSLNNNSSLTLTGNAFGVFGDGASKLTINNNLCSTGPCGNLVNSAGQDILLNGAVIRVAGVRQDQDVVLPNNFNVFAGNNAATVTISENGALFKVDETSTLTIGQTTVVKP